mmetsp:Transcript_36901/g.54161  ORF Transcript_36901/g.54161 Transcript_36901/m.54161 type:complete len:109 (-) Transcript_36901:195-521(-)
MLIQGILNLRNPSQQQLRAECMPAYSVCMWAVLSGAFLAGECLVFLKVDRTLAYFNTLNWLTTLIPAHVFFWRYFHELARCFVERAGVRESDFAPSVCGHGYGGQFDA